MHNAHSLHTSTLHSHHHHQPAVPSSQHVPNIAMVGGHSGYQQPNIPMQGQPSMINPQGHNHSGEVAQHQVNVTTGLNGSSTQHNNNKVTDPSNPFDLF
jgi:hypothetical protein